MYRARDKPVPRPLSIVLACAWVRSVAAMTLGQGGGPPLPVFHAEHVSQSSDARLDVAPQVENGTSSAVMEGPTAGHGASGALVINATFDSSITSDPNAASIEAAINNAIAVYRSLFNDPISVTIRFRYSTTLPDGTAMPGGALAVSTSVIYSVGWTTYITHLKADATTADDATASATLPTAALSTNVLPSSAGGRAIGLDTPPAMFASGNIGTGGPYDGIITLDSSAPFKFTRPAGSGLYDAQRTIEHEMGEVLGLGSAIGATSDLRPQDLFSWSAPGSRNTTSSGLRYFSVDGGQTPIVGFNQNASGDFGDWLSGSCPQATPYVQNAFACAGQASDVADGSPEGINLDVIGYDLIGSGPITTTTMNPLATTTTTTPAGTATTSTTIPGVCGVTPASGCHLGAARGASVQLKRDADVAKNHFQWKWGKGAATALADFKDPVHGTATYRVCVYDSSAKSQPLMDIDVPSGGTCGTRRCWAAVGTIGFNYRDSAGTDSGLIAMRLRSGPDRRARVQVTGRGVNLLMPSLGLTLPVTVQLLATDSSSSDCWQTTYTTDTRNDSVDFTATGP